MEILDEMDQSHRKEMQLYNSIFSLLSFEKIGYTGEAPHIPLHATQVLFGARGSREAVGFGQWAQAAPMARLWESSRWAGRCLEEEDRLEIERKEGCTCMALTEVLPTCPPCLCPPPQQDDPPLTVWGSTDLGCWV